MIVETLEVNRFSIFSILHGAVVSHCTLDKSVFSLKATKPSKVRG